MEEFVIRENTRRWERALEGEADPGRRQALERLITEERAHHERLKASRAAQGGLTAGPAGASEAETRG